MSLPRQKHIEELRQGLTRNLSIDFFDDEEIAEILAEIESFDPGIRRKILALSLTLSNKSSSLVPNVLRRLKRVARSLPLDDTERWMTHAFDLLDSQGIDAFMDFIARVDEASLRRFQAPEGLRLSDVVAVLEIYLRGIAGLELRISPYREAYSDTTTVFLPPTLSRFGRAEDNLLIYKILAAHLWGQIRLCTLSPDGTILRTLSRGAVSGHQDIESFFRPFRERNLAVDLYICLEAFRIEAFLMRELPGLMREARMIKRIFFEDRQPVEDLPPKAAVIEGLIQYHLWRRVKGEPPPLFYDLLARGFLLERAGGVESSLRAVTEFYEPLAALGDGYDSPGLPLVLPTIKPERVALNLRMQRRAKMKLLEGKLTKLINMPDLESVRMPSGHRMPPEQPLDPQKEYLLIKGKLIEVDENLKELIDESTGVPGGVLVKGSDFGSGSPISLMDLIEEDEEEETTKGGLKYDEWDYRRGDYKKDWCSLYERDLHPGHEPFVDLTLKRYGGYITILRKKFELLKREPRIVRRQKDGDGIDIDAVVEAFADLKAGISPGDDLFTRFDRQDRNMAVLLLIDMSGSTKGWVTQAEKESLVLMCEALESLGDRYSIYGFSGMTRTRCDLYRIKSFDEAYTEGVKRRIAGIMPKDYTRMGPALRHATAVLRKVEARTKLLITLSDGKPEDWDTYKGEYGIEDTRKALMEAREQGIHPFCITIDKEARSYLPHMFGEGRYICIDDVRKLPNRITEIYRGLTA